MTDVVTSDGVRLHAEATGSGLPVLFIHEFAADHRTWSRQVDALSGTFRCVTYAARGYPPSEVPPEQECYNYLRQADDAIDVLDAFGIARAHVVGLSMGGFCALQLGIRYPDRVSSLLVASAGSGASADRDCEFRAARRPSASTTTGPASTVPTAAASTTCPGRPPSSPGTSPAPAYHATCSVRIRATRSMSSAWSTALVRPAPPSSRGGSTSTNLGSAT